MKRLWVLSLVALAACDDGGGATPDEGDAGVDARLSDGPLGDGPLADGAPGDGALADGALADGALDGAPADAAVDAVAPGCPQPPPAGPAEVSLPQGLIKGREVATISSYLGIPFAAPPVGDLRWRAPEPPQCAPPAGLEATAFGPACPQLDAMGAPTGDEDCLQLNIWAPPTAAGPHAVMVFIHGGGNVQGSASVGAAGNAVYDGSALAEQFGVVVVTIQYRLGVLGWLVRPELADAGGRMGNYGLLDQIAALTWVKDHIEAFGGDPQRVMIFGESAGAVNVCALVASPLAAGFFQVSLQESGACVLPVGSEVERASREQTEASGCLGADEATCLRAKTPAQLLMDYPPVVGVSSRGTPFQPYIDGVVLPDQPEAVIRAGQHNRTVFVAGANADETAQAVPELADAAAYEAAVRAQFGPLANQVLEAYPAADFETPTKALVAVTTDARFVCTTRRSVRAAALHGPTYLYHFTQHLQNAPRLGAFGAYHGLELFFVFQNLDFAGYRPAPSERALALAMGGYWSRLATAGDPNAAGQPEWPLYDAASDRYLLLDGDGVVAGSGLRQARCDFWDALIDGL